MRAARRPLWSLGSAITVQAETESPKRRRAHPIMGWLMPVALV